MAALILHRSKEILLFIPYALFIYFICALTQPLVLTLSPQSPFLAFILTLALSSALIFTLKKLAQPLARAFLKRDRIQTQIAEELPQEPTPIPLKKSVTQIGDHKVLSPLHISPQLTTFATRQEKALTVQNLKTPAPTLWTQPLPKRLLKRNALALTQLKGVKHCPQLIEYGKLPDKTPFLLSTHNHFLPLKILKGQSNPKSARVLLHSLAKALKAIHKKKVFHNALTLKNISIDPHGTIHLSQFEFSSGIPASPISPKLSKSPYLPPEETLDAQASPALDIYALAAIILELSHKEELPHTRDDWPELTQRAGFTHKETQVLKAALSIKHYRSLPLSTFISPFKQD